jgi:integrase
MPELDVSTLPAEDLETISHILSKLTAGAEPKPKPAHRRRPKLETKYLTEDELDRLFQVIASPRDKAIFRVAYHRGLRASEVGKLQLSDYRPDSQRLYVTRLKGSLSGEFRLCDREVKSIRAWLKIRGAAPGPLFPSQRGNGISQQMLDVLIKAYGKKAGIPPEKCHMHALKHSCGTHLLARGENIEDVQDHLGHVNIQNTLIYARITNRRRQARESRLRDW